MVDTKCNICKDIRQLDRDNKRAFNDFLDGRYENSIAVNAVIY